MHTSKKNVGAVFIMMRLCALGTGAWLTPCAAATAQAADVSAQESPDSPAYSLEAVYTADAWRNAHGGLRTGGAYLDNLDLTLSVDGERAWGVRGLSAYAYLLRNNSARFSERYVGDAMTVSNIDAPEATRLYEAWMEWAMGTARPLSLRFGLYDLNSEFDTSDSRSLHSCAMELRKDGSTSSIDSSAQAFDTKERSPHGRMTS